MMNGVTGVGVNNHNYQTAFKAKPGDRKAIHEFIDKCNDLAADYLKRDKSLEEQKETFMRKSLKYLKDLKIKDLFAGKKVKPE